MSRMTVLLVVSCLPVLPTTRVVAAEPGGPAPHPAVRAIPGVTAPDAFPNACVDCHLNYTEREMDVRLSTLMASWRKGVEPRLLAKARAASAPGTKIDGKHPEATAALASIPGGCLACHGKGSTTAPPFVAMIHAIHLTGGPENVFIAHFQGECMHCHKLDAATGGLRVPSAPERR